ncbi:MAG TPA: tetrahydrofolate dehydrogenase/cyclohydrolase catalytic domain-containing protein [Eubacteriales bacterium]|jgi:methylenetetrahydrofolate dehydrogenase (NADP+)/methenyltetrahydrofolate cyclohydrolase|nr:tetrahydrofolate dehydrogenase/cyclohydrolase catalytic domain-containing protein [Clostridia bacterium]HRR90298.1 tetrahydrofolate dehydrogenase/cyclohydrolase catalytic domain-containing protein [Eubacteriales bacterium]HRU83824.1 tetrahydrofolate dehydrogenase/cyclohydrolase catalytic domain-containing protein [Eubacteriales bacterium]
MEPLILDGKKLAREIEAELAERVKQIVERTGEVPVLATIIVGNNPASETYVKMKCNACRRIGLEPKKIALGEDTTTDELLAVINELNADPKVCGILLQHPVPRGIDEQRCMNVIALEKDVDGVNTAGFGRMAMGLDAYVSATPLGIIKILERYGIEIEGKEAVVIGRSAILGKPVAMLLLNKNATVTICHSRTKNLAEIVRRADIVVAAVGKPEFVKADWIKEGAVIVDAGYNEGNVGDVDLKAAAAKSSAYTPVPGGVGPCTIAMLMTQTVLSAEKKAGLR